VLDRDFLRRENSVISRRLGFAGLLCHEVEANYKIVHFQPAEGLFRHCDGTSFILFW
jgi:hypothetical protein